MGFPVRVVASWRAQGLKTKLQSWQRLTSPPSRTLTDSTLLLHHFFAAPIADTSSSLKMTPPSLMPPVFHTHLQGSTTSQIEFKLPRLRPIPTHQGPSSAPGPKTSIVKSFPTSLTRATPTTSRPPSGGNLCRTIRCCGRRYRYRSRYTTT